MGKNVLFMVLLSGLILAVACKNSTSSKCGPCPEIAQLAPIVEVRIVDKTTGDDLFLSPNSPYTFADLKVTTSLAGQDVSISVDSTQKDNRFVRIFAESTQTFTLKLASLPADEIAVTTKNDSPRCCPFLRISKILLNNATICSPCSYNEMVTIKK